MEESYGGNLGGNFGGKRLRYFPPINSSKIFLQVFLHMEVILEEIMDEILQSFPPYGEKIGGKLGGNGAVGWAACGRWASISSHVDTRALSENRKVA